MTRHEVEMIKEKFQPGIRILLHEMKGEPQMYDGLEGTINHVDDIGQIHVHWDNGSSLALNYEEDSFEVTDAPNKLEVLFIEPGKYPKTIIRISYHGQKPTRPTESTPVPSRRVSSQAISM